MAILISPESAYGQELARWNRPRTQSVDGPNGTRVPGERAPGFERFPMLVYTTQQTHNGQTRSIMPQPDPRRYPNGEEARFALERDTLMVDDHNRRCCRKVFNDAEYQRALAEGYRDSPAEALELAESLAQDVARAAAEAAQAAEKLSPKAQRERKAREEAQSGQHLTE